jgi:hypothetical protein
MIDWEWIFVKPKDFREQVLRLPPSVRRNLNFSYDFIERIS